MAYEDIRNKYLGNTSNQQTSGTGGVFDDIKTKYLGDTSNQQIGETGGSFDDIRAKYLGGTTSVQQKNDPPIGLFERIKRLTGVENRPAGEKTTSMWTPLDYVLNSANYAFAGSLESGIKKGKEITKREQAGEQVSPLEKMATNAFSPTNWAGAWENLQAKNRKLAFDVVREQMPDSPLAAAIAFIGDLATPTPGTIAKAIKIPQALKVIGKTAKIPQVTKKIAQTAPIQKAIEAVTPRIKSAVEALQYQGGVPEAFKEQVDIMQKAKRMGIEKAEEVGKLLTENLTRAEQLRIGEIMRGGVTTEKTDPKLVSIATQARQAIDDLSKQILEQIAKGGGKQVTPTGLASDLINTLTRAFKPAKKGLGETKKGWKDPNELARELLGVYEKYQPAHAKPMTEIKTILPNGEEASTMGFTDIGANVRGVATGVKGGEEVLNTRLAPEGAIPFGGTIHAPEGTVPPTAYTQTPEGVTNVTARMGVEKPVEAGLPQKPPAKTILPVERIDRDPTTGGIVASEKTVQTIQENIGTYLPVKYRKYENDPEGFVKYLNSKSGKADMSNFIKRKDIPDDIKAAMGWILEPGYPAAKAIAQMSDQIAKSKLFRWTLDNFAQAENVTGDMVQMGNNLGYGVLANKWLPKQIAGEIKGMVTIPPQGFIKEVLDKHRIILNAWKYGKVIISFAARGRNQGSNMILMDLAGDMPAWEVLNPARWIEAAVELSKKGDFYKDLRKETDILDSTFYRSEFGNFLDNFAGGQGNAFMRFVKSMPSMPGRSYEWQEKWAKVVLAKYWVDQGKTIKEAAKITENALFNYDKIPDIVRKLRSSLIGYPFITFQYKAIPAITKAIIKKPEKFARRVRTARAMESETGRQKGKANLSMLPDYMQQGYIRLPIQDKEGRDLYLDLNYILPWGSLLERPSLAGVEPQNPLYTLSRDLSSNVSGFTGKSIYEETDDADEVMAKVGDYIYKTLMPNLAPAIPNVTGGGYTWEKIAKAYQQRPDYFGRVRDMPTVLTDVLLGLKATPIDYKKTAEVKRGKIISQINDIKTKIRTINLARDKFPDEKREETAKKVQQIKDLSRQLNELAQ